MSNNASCEQQIASLQDALSHDRCVQSLFQCVTKLRTELTPYFQFQSEHAPRHHTLCAAHVSLQANLHSLLMHANSCQQQQTLITERHVDLLDQLAEFTDDHNSSSTSSPSSSTIPTTTTTTTTTTTATSSSSTLEAILSNTQASPQQKSVQKELQCVENDQQMLRTMTSEICTQLATVFQGLTEIEHQIKALESSSLNVSQLDPVEQAKVSLIWTEYEQSLLKLQQRRLNEQRLRTLLQLQSQQEM